jgi:hypothetical protein
MNEQNDNKKQLDMIASLQIKLNQKDNKVKFKIKNKFRRKKKKVMMIGLNIQTMIMTKQILLHQKQTMSER